MKKKNIVFDFGGVLVDWNPRYVYRDLFDDELEMESFLSTVCTNEWNVQQDAGRSLVEATELLVAKFSEQEALIRRYYDDWKLMLKGEIPENTSLLQPLSEKYQLFGLTNWSGETFPYARERFPFFNKYFEGIVVSGDEKMIKPDKEIFQLLLDRYKIRAEESVFIDDNHDNIIAANEIGFDTVHLHEEVNLKHSLELMGIL